MENKKNHPIKNNCLSSSYLKYNGLNNLQNEKEEKFKENNEKFSNSSPDKNHYESQKHITNISLEQFMKTQNKKHLTTKFSHKDAEKFLKEKEKAMEKIIIEEDIINSSGNEEEKNENKNDINYNKNYKKLKQENNTSQFVIFHGTFGKEEIQSLNKDHHHHHHHRHHHHHHHHLKKQNQNIIDDNANGHDNKKENRALKC